MQVHIKFTNDSRPSELTFETYEDRGIKALEKICTLFENLDEEEYPDLTVIIEEDTHDQRPRKVTIRAITKEDFVLVEKLMISLIDSVPLNEIDKKLTSFNITRN